MRSEQVGTIGLAILDAIRAAGESKATPRSVAEQLGMPENSVTSHFSILHKKKLVTREPFTTDHNRLSYLYTAKPAADKAEVGAEPMAKKRRRKPHATAKVGVLITLQIGRKETVTLSYKDAAEVYEYLKEIFGRS